MKPLTLTLADDQHALLEKQATSAHFRTVEAWAKATLLEIARTHEALRELDRKNREARKAKT